MAFADIIGYIEPGALQAMLAGDFGFEITPIVMVVISVVEPLAISGPGQQTRAKSIRLPGVPRLVIRYAKRE